MLAVHRRRDDHQWSESTRWSNPGSNSCAAPVSPAYGSIKQQVRQDPASFFALLCICIQRLPWTYIVVWEAKQGILSNLPSKVVISGFESKGTGHQVFFDMLPPDRLPSLAKGTLPKVRKSLCFVRDTGVKDNLYQTITFHVELVMKGFFLLPARSGFFAAVLILVVPRSMLFDVLEAEVFGWIALGERLHTNAINSYSRPICVPWGSPSLRQDNITHVMNQFRCNWPINPLHDYHECSNLKPIEQHVSIADRIARVEMQLFTYPVRSRPGPSSGPGAEQAFDTVNPDRLPSLAHASGKNVKPPSSPGDEDEEDPGDEDDDDREPPRKRKRQSKGDPVRLRLPCIFHVHDRRGHTRDSTWKHCNPETTSYTDPSALCRHLKRRHEIVDDKRSVKKAEPSVAVCKNCWTKIPGTTAHWSGGIFNCQKPARRPTPTDKWWTLFEAFCGPRTEAASLYLDYLMAETRPHYTSQVATPSPPGRIHHWLSTDVGAASDIVPQDTAVALAWSATSGVQPSGHSFQEEVMIQPYGQHEVAGEQPGHLTQLSSSFGFSPWPRATHLNNSGFAIFSETSSQSLAHESQQPTFSHCQPQMSSNTFWPGTLSSSVGYQALSTDLESLVARLRLAEETAQLANQRALSAEARAQMLEQQCMRQSSMINKLSETISSMQTLTTSTSNEAMDPSLFPTPIRADTNNSTESDLSGIAERVPPTPGTVEDFNADVASGQAETPQQDPRGLQYLPELEMTIPRARQGMPSIDSGYGTNKTDDSSPQFVKPSDTVMFSIDSDYVFPHT